MSSEEKILAKLDALQQDVDSLKGAFDAIAQHNQVSPGMTNEQQNHILAFIDEIRSMPKDDEETLRFGEFMDAEKARKVALYG
ncbi:MAG: hypothetical protein IJ849_11605 [Selenomonadaceae bacterium]|nr:hypothetical protein [Selenomonadaceae bacterium]